MAEPYDMKFTMPDKKTARPPEYALAGEALRNFYERSNQKLERLLTTKGISFAKARMMSYIDMHPATRSIDLMEAFGHAPRTITEAIDALEREDLVARLPDPADRRAKTLELTELGKTVLATFEPTLRNFRNDLFAVFSKEEIDQLGFLVTRLNQRLEEM